MGQSAVNITINNRELRIACPNGEESALIAAAKELDQRLTSLLAKGKSASLEQALLMVSLNLTNDLLKLQSDFKQEKDNTASKIALLQSTIEHALSEQSIKRA